MSKDYPTPRLDSVIGYEASLIDHFSALFTSTRSKLAQKLETILPKLAERAKAANQLFGVTRERIAALAESTFQKLNNLESVLLDAEDVIRTRSAIAEILDQSFATV